MRHCAKNPYIYLEFDIIITSQVENMGKKVYFVTEEI